MYETLRRAYGPQHWWPAGTAFEMIVGAYLTQNTSWRAVERSLDNLRQRHVLSIEGLRELPEEELRVLIRPSGYMIRKSAALKAFVAFVDREWGGALEALAPTPTADLRHRLLALPGVGPETADAILLYAFGHPVMVVDEYFRRVAARHGLAPERAPHSFLSRLGLAAFRDDPPHTLPAHLNELHALVVNVGKLHCGPSPRCNGCPLATYPAPIPRGF
jgi:endonuclease-3 related protein